MHAVTQLVGQFDSTRQSDALGDYWSARDLQPALGYVEWRKFEDAIERAQAAITNSGMDAADHVGGAAKMIEAGKGATRLVTDYRLTKYGAYMVAMNGDPRKAEIAAAQTYFAVRTHQAETQEEQRAISRRELAQMVIEQEDALEQAGAHIAALEPRATAWDAIASAEGDYSVGDAAKILARAGVTTGPQRLFNQLSSLGWTYRGADTKWRAYADRVENGHLGEKPQFHFHPETGERVLDTPQVRVTAKGLELLRQRLGGKPTARLERAAS